MITLNSCLVCQAFLLSDSPLCEFCSRQFHERVERQGVVVRRSPVFVQSLWSWSRDNEELSRALIYSLKGNSDPRRWLKFATLLLQASVPLPRGSCLIPIPSKQGKSDHATGFARALCCLTGDPVEEILRSKVQRHQRELTRRQRSHIAFEKAQRWRKSYSHYVLVDDVVTSGATLRAAFLALNEPISIQGLCLMDRAPVAEIDGSCYSPRQC